MASSIGEKKCPVLIARWPGEESVFLGLLKNERIDIAPSLGWDYIFNPAFFHQVPTINMHPSALPYHRGCHHSFWAIMKRRILGLHFIG